MKKPDYVNSVNNNSTYDSNHFNVRHFNPEVIGSIKPQGELRKDMKDWEKVIVMNLNSRYRKFSERYFSVQ